MRTEETVTDPRVRTRSAAGGARALLTTAGLTVLTSGLLSAPASAVSNGDIGPREGADLDSGIGLGMTVLLYLVVPAVILIGTAALVWLPGMVKADRYRPTKGWRAAPVWFAGPPDPVAAVETANVGQDLRGGASGSW